MAARLLILRSLSVFALLVAALAEANRKNFIHDQRVDALLIDLDHHVQTHGAHATLHHEAFSSLQLSSSGDHSEIRVLVDIILNSTAASGAVRRDILGISGKEATCVDWHNRTLTCNIPVKALSNAASLREVQFVNAVRRPANLQLKNTNEHLHSWGNSTSYSWGNSTTTTSYKNIGAKAAKQATLEAAHVNAATSSGPESFVSAQPLVFGTPVVIGSNSTAKVVFTVKYDLYLFYMYIPSTNFVIVSALPQGFYNAGQNFSITVMFQPTIAGELSAQIVVQAASAVGYQYTTNVAGTGLANGPLLTASNINVDVGWIVVNSVNPATVDVDFQNFGSVPLTISQVVAPSFPFTLTDLKPRGATLKSLEKVSIGVSLSSTSTKGSFSSFFTVVSTGGNITVTIRAIVANPSVLIVLPTVQLGSITVGTYALKSFNVTNAGGVPLIFSKSKQNDFKNATVTMVPPGIQEGTAVMPGETLIVQLYVLPRTVGVQKLNWIIQTNDKSGMPKISLILNGTVQVGWVSPPSLGTWNLLGVATLVDGGQGILQLTPSIYGSLGLAWSRDVVDTGDLQISFIFSIDSYGADGMALLLTDPANGLTPVGESAGLEGGDLGYYPLNYYYPPRKGIPSTYAVVINTFPNYEFGDLSDNDILVNEVSADGYAASRRAGQDVYGITILKDGAPHRLDVSIRDKRISISLDGIAINSIQDVYLDNLPSAVRLGLSGATGGLYETHRVWNMVITSPGGVLVASPSTVSVTAVVNSASPVPVNVTLSNVGRGPLGQIQINPPPFPFVLVRVPSLLNRVLAPGDSLSFGLTVEPNLPSYAFYDSSLVVVTSKGPVAVPVKAGVFLSSGPYLQAPSSISLAAFPVGVSTSTTVDLTNQGGAPIRFLTGNSLIRSEDALISISPNYPALDGVVLLPAMTITIRFDVLPKREGQRALTWAINTTENQGVSSITFVINGFKPVGWVSPPSLGTWNLIGTAILLDGGVLQLTPNRPDPIGLGIAWSPDVVNTTDLQVSFTFSAEYYGADGLALLLTDPANGLNAIGGEGGGALGYFPGSTAKGINSTHAVVINTYYNREYGDIYDNDILVNEVSADGYTGYVRAGQYIYSTYLKDGRPHRLDVTIRNKQISIALDGYALYAIQNFPLENLPEKVRLGFSGGIGGLQEYHKVWNVAITSN